MRGRRKHGRALGLLSDPVLDDAVLAQAAGVPVINGRRLEDHWRRQADRAWPTAVRDGPLVWDLRRRSDGGSVLRDEEIVWLDVAAVDRLWKIARIEPGGSGAIGARYPLFERFLELGLPIRPPHLGLVKNTVMFGDGRHRFSVLRDRGVRRVPAAVPRSEAKRLRELAGAPAPNPSKTALARAGRGGRGERQLARKLRVREVTALPPVPVSGRVATPAVEFYVDEVEGRPGSWSWFFGRTEAVDFIDHGAGYPTREAMRADIRDALQRYFATKAGKEAKRKGALVVTHVSRARASHGAPYRRIANPRRAGEAIARGFGAPPSSFGFLESVHEFKEETRRRKKEEEREARRQRMAAKRRRNPDPGRPQVLSFGGGVDSMCMLVDAMQRKKLPDVVVFMDVGDPDRQDPAEWPETYTYITEVVKPLLDRLGVEFVWITSKMYPIRDARSLYEWFKERGQVPISGPDHLCSVVAKVERFEKWMQDYFQPGTNIDVWIGFAKGEESRSRRDPHGKERKIPKRRGESKAAYEKRVAALVKRHNRFPLQERGLSREDCKKLIASAGFQVPRKSACVFCPYGKREEWEVFAKRLPEQFRKIMALEREKDLTTRGYKIFIKDFKKYGLTTSQYRVMQAIAGGETAFKGSDKKTLSTLQKRSWVSPELELTSYGRTILEEAGPTWTPPISPKTRKPVKSDTDVVERAALGGCVEWRELKSKDERRCIRYERKPILGIHYEGTPIETYAGFESEGACRTTTEEDALDDAVAGNLVPVSRLGRGRQLALLNPQQRLKRKLMR